MRFRAPLLNQNGDIDNDVWQLLSNRQVAKLYDWACTKDVTLQKLLRESRYMAQQIGYSHEVMLEGTHFVSGYYGCIMPDGSVHAW